MQGVILNKIELENQIQTLIAANVKLKEQLEAPETKIGQLMNHIEHLEIELKQLKKNYNWSFENCKCGVMSNEKEK